MAEGYLLKEILQSKNFYVNLDIQRSDTVKNIQILDGRIVGNVSSQNLLG